MHIPLDDAYWKMYTIVIQAGAILALLLLYLERIVAFVKSFPQGESGDRTWKNHPISLTLDRIRLHLGHCPAPAQAE